ncbi:mRNA decay activator protein zfp36 [Parelaphostrongylus tenuis]|uniref:mRNA decay activator protein zfp36 n=1 Tax=Parelaphostrongylus tenuis TaxID=148309 RepID=A0AAD5QUF8_PARTN|nr:mRNA decay activator protein zfp36 [Parelaphostrongylus tenuis]
MQAATQLVDPNQIYYAAVPPQPAATHQQSVPYQYGGGFFAADPYMVAPPPSQGSQPVIMPVGHPGYIYMPPPSATVYYPVPAAPHAATAPYYYTPDVIVQQTMPVPQQFIHTHAIVPGDVPLSKVKSTVRPLSTSTPLPTEFSSIPTTMTNLLPYAGNVNAAHFKCHRNMEQEDVLANLSKISVVSEETMEIENERDCEHRPPRQQCPPPVPLNYKTRMCMTYASGKRCEMGNRCKFAHGSEELRVIPDAVGFKVQRIPNSRYKTKLCKNFGPYASNYCPYGTRCEFIHPNDKEYAFVCSSASQASRNSHNVGNMSQSMCNVTPETVCEAPPNSVTRSAVKPAAEKILLKNRNVAGSMMCLPTIGRREQSSDDSAVGSGSSESGVSCAHAKALTRAREGVPAALVPIKFLRRRSMSQLTLKRFNSIENLDIAASCSQLANLDQNRKQLGVLSPFK